MREKFDEKLISQDTSKEYSQEDVDRLKEREKSSYERAKAHAQKIATRLGMSEVEGDWEYAVQEDAKGAPRMFVEAGAWEIPPNGPGRMAYEGSAYFEHGELKKTDQDWRVRIGGKRFFGGPRHDFTFCVPRTEWTPSEIQARLDVEKTGIYELRDAADKAWDERIRYNRYGAGEVPQDVVRKYLETDNKLRNFENSQTYRTAIDKLKAEQNARMQTAWAQETK